MRWRMSLGLQVFLSILVVSLSTTLIVGLFARSALSSAFDEYLSTLPASRMQGRMGAGRMMLGAAEQSFIGSVDQSVIIASLVAAGVAVIVSLLLAAYLAKPLRRLEHAAEELAGGDFAHRVPVQGPTEVAALGEAFNGLADSLEQAEELRRRLVADVAHELRNPLAAARAQAEGMAEGVLHVDEKRLASLVDDLTHLSALIDDLQELAVAEAGRLSYDMRSLELDALVVEEAERARPLLAEGVALVVQEASGSLTVAGDERRLSQVMRNLLSNAARHTKEGSITVSTARDGDEVVVSVSDTGEGMDPEEVTHIFERFYRADTARASYTGGAGLGLAISRSIVTDHGGSVFARSEQGTGTTVGFRLPLASQQEA